MSAKASNWFLPAMHYGRVLRPATISQQCSGCDAPATGWDAHAAPYCCDACRRAVETPTLPHCRCAFLQSQRRVAEAAS